MDRFAVSLALVALCDRASGLELRDVWFISRARHVATSGVFSASVVDLGHMRAYSPCAPCSVTVSPFAWPRIFSVTSVKSTSSLYLAYSRVTSTLFVSLGWRVANTFSASASSKMVKVVCT